MKYAFSIRTVCVNLQRYPPASIEPDQRSTIFSTTTANISSSFKGRLLMTIESLNSPRALGLEAVLPPFDTLALRP